jgi:glycine cleavage system H lipoate-binding protein
MLLFNLWFHPAKQKQIISGWIADIQMENKDEWEALLDANAYAKHTAH